MTAPHWHDDEPGCYCPDVDEVLPVTGGPPRELHTHGPDFDGYCNVCGVPTDEQPAPLVAGRIESSVRDAYNAGGLWAAYERYLDELQQGRERPSM